MKLFEKTAINMSELFGDGEFKGIISLSVAKIFENNLFDLLKEEYVTATKSMLLANKGMIPTHDSLCYDIKQEKFYIEIWYDENHWVKRPVALDIESRENFFHKFTIAFKEQLVNNDNFRAKVIDRLVSDYIEDCLCQRR